MFVVDLLLASGVAALSAGIFARALKKAGPLISLLAFFLLIFTFNWLNQALGLTLIRPVFWGLYLVPFFMIVFI